MAINKIKKRVMLSLYCCNVNSCPFYLFYSSRSISLKPSRPHGPPSPVHMLRAVRRMVDLTAAIYRSTESFQSPASRLLFSSDSGATNSRTAELTRLSSVLEGCDYEHWLVVMEAPKGYPVRDEIVRGYVKTLAMALGSEEEAKNAIYSVSTKYYYAFGCKVPERLTFKIKSLPSVIWVLPDSYLCYGENGYGGEPFLNGEIAPYNEKYHEEWIRDQDDDKRISLNSTKKSRRRKRKKSLLIEDVATLQTDNAM